MELLVPNSLDIDREDFILDSALLHNSITIMKLC